MLRIAGTCLSTTSGYHYYYHYCYHSTDVHHQIATPSPISTTYIDGVDATLQATLPLLLAGGTPQKMLFHTRTTHRRA